MGSERDRAIAEAVRDACREVADEARDAIDGVDLDAIIAAVDAQHPAPALPREVAMRIAEEVRWMLQRGGATHNEHLRAIVSRHLPTDEERETERAVVEAALAMRHTFPAGREWTPTEIALYNAAAHLLAIRAKRGAR